VEVGKEFFTESLESALRGSLEPIEMEDFKKRLYDYGTREAIDGREPMPLYLSQFIDVWESDISKVYVANGSEMWLRCSLLDPSVLSAPIFQGVHASILMSGTLHPGEMYADLLGIPNPVIRAYESPYPRENKKVVTTEFLTTLYSKRSRRMYQAYANQIAEIARHSPGNIAAFFPSYSIMEFFI
jgi:DNA excision repair protein ERCC-2